MAYKDKQKLKDWQEANKEKVREYTLCFDCHQIQHTKNFYESKYAKENNFLLGDKNFS